MAEIPGCLRIMELWEQQTGESAKAYQAFVLYRDFGSKRSLQSVWKLRCAQLGLSTKKVPGNWTRWCTAQCWVQRANAFDAHRERLEHEARDAKMKELIYRRMEWELKAQDALEALAERVRMEIVKLIEMPSTTIEQTKYGEDGKIISKSKVRGIPPSELARLLEVYLELQARTVHGLIPTKRTIQVLEQGF